MTQPSGNPLILAVNGGSSSLKFGAFERASTINRVTRGAVSNFGQPHASLEFTQDTNARRSSLALRGSAQEMIQQVTATLRELFGNRVMAIGHRIVHGGIRLFEPQVITKNVLEELRTAIPLDEAHLPFEILLIEMFADAFPMAPHIACFDTTFHHHMPAVASMLPIPRRYAEAGLKRFGFHGLSYTYIQQELSRVAGPTATHGKVIVAHLGSGASMTALVGGQPVDTTMGFTPNSGLVMGTRSGDLEPGLVTYLMRQEHLSPSQMDELLTRQSGLLGISETTANMQTLLENRARDPRAAEAVELFCYQARRHIGALAAVIGGIETLVFTGGIGQHAPVIRSLICEPLSFLGVRLDPDHNVRNVPVISSESSAVIVRVMATDEEMVIAQTVNALLTP